MDILVRNVMFADNVDCRRKEMVFIDLVRTVGSDDEN